MEGNELIAFEIIANCGAARSSYIEAIQLAKKGEFAQIDELFKDGDEVFLLGHEAHSKLLTKEAETGIKTEISLLLLHAEDQLMSAESFRTIAKEFVELYKKLK